MTDQPSTNHSDQEPTTDQPANQNGVVGDQPPTDQDDAPVLVSLEEAAAKLGISVNAVRQRIKRNTVAAVKTDAGWLVDMVATNQRPTTNRPTNQPTDHMVGATNQQPTIDVSSIAEIVERQNQRFEEQNKRIDELLERDLPEPASPIDLAPLAEVIDRFSRQIDERDQRIQEQHERIETLSSSEAMWRTHALHLQNRVAELEELASVEAGQSSTDEPVEPPEQDDDADTDTQPPSGDHESLRTPVEDIPSQVVSTKVERRARVDLIAGDITVPSIEERKSAQRWWERWMRRLVGRGDVDS